MTNLVPFGAIWSLMDKLQRNWTYLERGFFCPERLRDSFGPKEVVGFFVVPRGGVVFLFEQVE